MITAKKYKNIKTGEVTTQVPILQMSDYVEVKYTIEDAEGFFRGAFTSIQEATDYGNKYFAYTWFDVVPYQENGKNVICI